jgi:hypothetical protein
LEQCGKIKDDEWREIFKSNKQVAEMEKEHKADPRGQFLKKLPKDQPENADRIAAFDRLNTRFCHGLEETEVTKAELNALYASASKLGDVPSIARAFACGIAGEMPKTNPNASFAEQIKQEPAKIEFTPARQTQLQELLRAGHPDSVRYLMWAMNQDYTNVKIKLPGQTGTRFDIQDFSTKRALEELLACDLGKVCAGANNPDLERRCAHQSQCNLQSIPDAIHFYELSPSSSQRVEQTRQALRDAIATGNFSALKFEPVEARGVDGFFISSQAGGQEIGCYR